MSKTYDEQVSAYRTAGDWRSIIELYLSLDNEDRKSLHYAFDEAKSKLPQQLALEAAAEAPALEGSEKQVAWATDKLRPDVFAACIKFMTGPHYRRMSENEQAAFTAAFEQIKQQTSAKWFIDARLLPLNALEDLANAQ